MPQLAQDNAREVKKIRWCYNFRGNTSNNCTRDSTETLFTLSSNFLETPDLVLAIPLAPHGHRGAWFGIAVVSEIDIHVGFFTGEDAEKRTRQSDRLGTFL